MNSSTVKSKIEKMFARENDFNFVFIDGHGDSRDEYRVIFTGVVYAKDYKCQINITFDFNDRWAVDVNGFNKMIWIKNEAELEFAIKQQQRFARTPCFEQEYQHLVPVREQDSFY